MQDFLRAPLPPEELPVTCESCGKQVPADEAIGFACTFFRPGKTASGLPLGSFGCYAGGHLGCSVEHAVICAKRCIDEHLIPGRAMKEAATISGVS